MRVAVVASGCLLLTATSAALARQPLLHLSFHRSGKAATVLSDARYAFAAPAQLAQAGVLYDDVAHRQRRVPQGGCGVAGSQILGDVLAFDCWRAEGKPPKLYSIGRRTWRAVPLSPQVTATCGPYNTCNPLLTQAGSQWLEFSRSDCPIGTHCSYSNLFQNLNSGKVENDPAVEGGHEIADLNSPGLAHRICSPLTVPKGFNIFTAPGPGQLLLEGRFALATGAAPKGGTQTYLEKCGTHLHQLIQSSSSGEPVPVAASPDAVVWQHTPADLSIEFLPTRRRFQIPLPKPARPGVAGLALTDHRLYAIAQDQTLWVASIPARPAPG